MAELVDATDLESVVERRGSSSLSRGTKKNKEFSMHKDFVGTELKQGDTVQYTDKSNGYVRTASIHGFNGEHLCLTRTKRGGNTEKFHMHPSKVVKK